MPYDHCMAETKTRKHKTPGFHRRILADNVLKLMQKQYPNAGNKPGALAKSAGLSLSTVQRVLAQDQGASIDIIEALAEAFDVSVYQLLLPALDPDNPQVVREAAAAEKRMYRAWKRAGLGVPAKEEVDSR